MPSGGATNGTVGGAIIRGATGEARIQSDSAQLIWTIITFMSVVCI